MIASCTGAAYDWNHNNVQESDPISLEADKAYYIDAYHNDYGGGHHVKMRVGLEKTKHTNNKVGAARDEKQKITISSTLLWEKQVCPVRQVNQSRADRIKSPFSPIKHVYLNQQQ